MIERLGRIRREWQWRAAGLTVAALAVSLIAAFATRDVISVWWAIALIAASGGSVAGLLYLTDRSDRERASRDDELGSIRDQGKRLAIYDRGTGLYAYWYFNLRLQEEITRSGRYGQPFALLLVEAARGRLDRDEEGRLFWSMVTLFRESDLVAHLGNLRFVVLLLGTDAEGAQVVRKRLLKNRSLRGVSIGLASYPEGAANVRTLLVAAGAPAELVDAVAGMANAGEAGRASEPPAAGEAKSAA